MKLKLFIALLVITNSVFAVDDSVARIRKPVLRYLLEQERKARFLMKEDSLSQVKIKEKDIQNTAYLNTIKVMRSDSVIFTELIFVAEQGRDEFKRVYNTEKAAHKRTKQRSNLKSGLIILIIIVSLL